jgi:hypothetical protein
LLDSEGLPSGEVFPLSSVISSLVFPPSIQSIDNDVIALVYSIGDYNIPKSVSEMATLTTLLNALVIDWDTLRLARFGRAALRRGSSRLSSSYRSPHGVATFMRMTFENQPGG